jgi:uncharacterized protein with PIN domain
VKNATLESKKTNWKASEIDNTKWGYYCPHCNELLEEEHPPAPWDKWDKQAMDYWTCPKCDHEFYAVYDLTYFLDVTRAEDELGVHVIE